MADINARTRLLIGTTANWAASDLVLGDGELVMERAGTAIKMKAGNGSAKYSALPFLTMTPVVPPEYLTQTQSDARYLLLSDVVTGKTANKVPRLDATGLLNSAVVPLPPAIDVSTGVADAGKLVKLSSTGKISPSMITVTTGTYRGLTDGTLAVPAGTYLAGDYYINTGSGPAHASWGLPAATNVGPGQQLVYDGTKWGVVGAASGDLVQLPDGTAAAPGLSFVNDTNVGLYRPAADTLGITVGGVQRVLVTAGSLRTITGTSGTVGNGNFNDLVVETGGSGGMSMRSPAASAVGLMFCRPSFISAGGLLYDHATDLLTLQAASAARVTVGAAGITTALPLLTGSGTAAAPSHAFSAQPNYGLFHITNVGVGFTVGGVEAGRISAAGMMFSAGNTGITHNDTLTYIAMCAAASVADGNARVICYDSAHASNAKQVYICGTQIVFTDDAAGTQRGRFTATTDRTELLLGINHTAGLNSLSNRGLVELDGASDSMLSLTVANGKIGYVQAAPASLNVGTQIAVPILLKVNGVTTLACNTDGTVDISGIEAGWKSLPANVRTANYTLVIGDRGKHVRADSPVTLINCPGAVFAGGDVVTLVNNTSGNISIGATGGLSLQLAGTASVGTRTLAQHGVANVLYLSSTVAIVSGGGLT